MFDDMMGKLQAMQGQVAETKKRLDTISVSGEAGGGAVKVQMNGNRKMVNISVSPDAMEDHEELEDLILVATNRALEQAEKVYESEMSGAAGGLLGGMGL